MTGNVAHGYRQAVVGQFERVVPVAANFGFLAGGAVGAVQLPSRHPWEACRQKRPLEAVGHVVGPFQQCGLVERVGQLKAKDLGDLAGLVLEASSLLGRQHEDAAPGVPAGQRDDENALVSPGA